MLRIAALWYLILATAAGPAVFCCCKTRGLIDSFQGQLAPVQVAPQPKSPSCCHADPAPVSEPPDESDPAPDNTPPDQCPCPQKDGKPVMLAADQDFARTLTQSFALALPTTDGYCPFATLPLELTRTSLPSDGSALPFLSAQDLLRAHHQLRC